MSDIRKCGRNINYEVELANVREIDWAQLAAFIDGEGNLRLNAIDAKIDNRGANRTRYRCVIRITNTDVRLADWCKQHFGGTVVFRTSKDRRWKDSWTWHAIDGRAAFILKKCLPFFVMKRAQAEVVLAFRATYSARHNPSARKNRLGRLLPIDPQIHQSRKILAAQLKKMTCRGREVITEMLQ